MKTELGVLYLILMLTFGSSSVDACCNRNLHRICSSNCKCEQTYHMFECKMSAESQCVEGGSIHQGWHPEILRGVVLRVGRSLRSRLSSAALESAGEIWGSKIGGFIV